METFLRDRSRALTTIRVVILLLGSLLVKEQVRAQEVDKDGLYSQPSLVLDPEMHNADIRAAGTDAARRFIITGSIDKSVRVWSIDGRLLRTIRLPSGPGTEGSVFAVAVSPNGDTIAAAGQSPNIFLFERATGRAVSRIELPNDASVGKLAFSHDGRRIAAGLGTSKKIVSIYLTSVLERRLPSTKDMRAKYKGYPSTAPDALLPLLATANFGSMTAILS
jgi:WD40 repeat protein